LLVTGERDVTDELDDLPLGVDRREHLRSNPITKMTSAL
jgi:hypothetical protein